MDEPKYVVYCESFYTASRYAAEQGWSLSEWQWLPNRTIHSGVAIFERVS